MAHPALILIGGPTASGKSALALRIARERNGTVINADAMQIYSGLPILTAQPSPEDKAAAPHELYEVTDPAEASSAGKWKILAEDAIRRTLKAGRVPIIVGGTGLYFRALLGGLADIPAIPDEVRQETKNLYDKIGSEAFRAKLAEHDPDSASRIKPNDRQRLIRAFEVVIHTKKPLGFWHGTDIGMRGDGADECVVGETRFTVERHRLAPPRDRLYEACDTRFLTMMKRGALEEVRAIAARNLSQDLPAMKILGVRELLSCLRGDITQDQAIAQAQQATRNYAKRQLTWFRNQWPDTKAFSQV